MSVVLDYTPRKPIQSPEVTELLIRSQAWRKI